MLVTVWVVSWVERHVDRGYAPVCRTAGVGVIKVAPRAHGGTATVETRAFQPAPKLLSKWRTVREQACGASALLLGGNTRLKCLAAGNLIGATSVVKSSAAAMRHAQLPHLDVGNISRVSPNGKRDVFDRATVGERLNLLGANLDPACMIHGWAQQALWELRVGSPRTTRRPSVKQ